MSKFISDREIAFINKINRELIQRVVGQEVVYYEISLKETQSNKLYGEAPQKVWKPPVKVNALVRFDNSTTVAGSMGMDSKYSLDVFFHNEELTDRNLLPKEGDFIEFGQIFFEIMSVTQPKLTFGQFNAKIMTKCSCTPSREGQFAAGGNTQQGIDNSHPVPQRKAENK